MVELGERKERERKQNQKHVIIPQTLSGLQAHFFYSFVVLGTVLQLGLPLG